MSQSVIKNTKKLFSQLSRGTNTSIGIIQSIIGGTNITVDNTDPLNPIVNSSSGSQTLSDVVNAGNVVSGDIAQSTNGTSIFNLTDTSLRLRYISGAVISIMQSLSNRVQMYFTDGTNTGSVTVTAVSNDITHTILNKFNAPNNNFPQEIPERILRLDASGNLKSCSIDEADILTTTNAVSTYEPKNPNIQAHIIDTTNPHSVTKTQVGLSNVDDTSDLDKPVSIAQQTALNLKENLSEKGVANGYAPLDASNLIPTIHLPGYVDDVLEYIDLAALPLTGEVGKIYITLDTNKTYRWSGSVYVELTDATAVWGQVSGLLSSQTDLQNALNLKEDLNNKQTDLIASGTKYPTVNAVNTGLDLKENTSNKNNTILNNIATEFPTSSLVKNNIEYNVINTSVALTVLTNASRFKTIHIGSTYNSKVNAPNATTLTNGLVIEAINDSLETVVYYATDGITEIGRVYPLCSLKLILLNNGTANGVWNAQMLRTDIVKTFFDDFNNVATAGVTGNENWGPGLGTGSTIAAGGLSSSLAVGRIGLALGTNAAGFSSIRQQFAMIGFNAANTVNDGVRVFESAIQFATLPTAINNCISNIGIGRVNGAEQDDGVYFVTDATISANWILRTSRASVRTSVITTVPVTTNVALLRIEINNRTTLAEFFINNISVGTISTNIPFSPTSLVIGHRRSLGVTNIILNCDYVKFTQYFPR